MRYLQIHRSALAARSQKLTLSLMALTFCKAELTSKIWQGITPKQQNWSLFSCGSCLLILYTCTLYFPPMLPKNVCLGPLQNFGTSSQRAWFQRVSVSLSQSLENFVSLVVTLQKCSSTLEIPTQVATRRVPSCWTFFLAPKPVVKSAVCLTAAAQPVD